MNKRIFKYHLSIQDTQTVALPEGAEILTVQTQGNWLCLWAMVNPKASPKDREIEIFGTGHPMTDEKRRYISTVQMRSGTLVWHVFEKE